MQIQVMKISQCSVGCQSSDMVVGVAEVTEVAEDIL